MITPAQLRDAPISRAALKELVERVRKDSGDRMSWLIARGVAAQILWFELRAAVADEVAREQAVSDAALDGIR
jgi:hypothetical protein